MESGARAGESPDASRGDGVVLLGSAVRSGGGSIEG